MRTVSKLGVNLPMPREYTRNAADLRRAGRRRLAARACACSVTDVVEALPQGAETFRLIRYPSPGGRFYTSMCKPPIFLFDGNALRARRCGGRGGFRHIAAAPAAARTPKEDV